MAGVAEVRQKLRATASRDGLARPADLHVRARCNRCDHFSKKPELDERGRTMWTEASPSIQAKITVSGLTAGTTHYFRNRPITKAGPGDWSQVVSLLVDVVELEGNAVKLLVHGMDV